jgi:HPt (histidine-containing phosphotransfer) domain-containing protein
MGRQYYQPNTGMLRTEKKTQKKLDRQKLLEDCDGEASFANQCLQMFVRETQADLDAISAAFKKEDLVQVSWLAHRIKGASASIRAGFLSEEAARLNLLGCQGKRSEAAVCFARLQAEFDDFKKFVVTLPRLPD